MFLCAHIHHSFKGLYIWKQRNCFCEFSSHLYLYVYMYNRHSKCLCHIVFSYLIFIISNDHSGSRFRQKRKLIILFCSGGKIKWSVFFLHSLSMYFLCISSPFMRGNNIFYWWSRQCKFLTTNTSLILCLKISLF